jgi:cyclopropane fatty-acyl-phospholipid synthase-like methyltransferase
MDPRGAPGAAGRVDARYDEHYFDAELHRHHWFRNNAAKRARRWHEVLRMLEPRATDRILEIGCAAGEHAIRLAGLARQVVGIDLSFPGVRRAKDRARRARQRNVTFAASDAAALPFSDAAFDKVAAIDFVEHVDDALLARVFAEVNRVLAADGIVAIYTPCLTHYVEWLKQRNLILQQIPGHIGVRRPEAYREMLDRSGFRIRSCRFLPSDYPLFGAIDRAFVTLPGIGRWFRFRICIVAAKAS